MMHRKQLVIVLVMTSLMSMPGLPAPANAAGRSYEECQALAVARGVQPRFTRKVFHNYLRYKAAGTAIRPRGLVARCMAGVG